MNDIAILNIDVDLINAVAVNGKAKLVVSIAGKSLLVKAFAPADGMLDWMSTPRKEGDKPLLGSIRTRNVVVDGKAVQAVESVVVGCCKELGVKPSPAVQQPSY